MLKRIISTGVVLAATFLASVASAQVNIAVVDVQAAILGSSYGQSELSKLNNNAEYSELVTTVRAIEAEIQSLDRNAESNAGSWTADDLADYNKQRQYKIADLQLASQKIQAEREQVIGQIYAAMNERALTALQELIEEEGVTLLLKETAVYQATSVHNLTAKLAAKLGQ